MRNECDAIGVTMVADKHLARSHSEHVGNF